MAREAETGRARRRRGELVQRAAQTDASRRVAVGDGRDRAGATLRAAEQKAARDARYAARKARRR
jgi:hypothetical protein